MQVAARCAACRPTSPRPARDSSSRRRSTSGCSPAACRPPPPGNLPLPRRRRTSGVAAAAAASASFRTPRQTRRPSAEVPLKPRRLGLGGTCSRPWRQRRHSLPSLVISCLFYLTCKYISLPAALVLSFCTCGFHTTTTGDHAFQTPRSQPPRTYTCYGSSAARRLIFVFFFRGSPSSYRVVML